MTPKSSTNKPRLLIILNRFVIGGQAVDTIPLAWNLQKDFDIRILYGEKEKDEVEPDFLLKKYPGLHMKKIRFMRRSVNPFIDALAFFDILSNIISFKTHIVHTHGAKSGFTGRIAAWLCRVPVVIHTFHGHLFHSYFSANVSRFISFAERVTAKITTGAIALSKVQKTELTEDFRIMPAEKFRIIPLGFAFDSNEGLSFGRERFRNRYSLHTEDVAIGIVGRIVPVKNHLFFIEVIDQILSLNLTSPPAFFIIGDGALRGRLEKELAVKNISFSTDVISEHNRVVFTSWLTDMHEVMNGLDIIALTSLNEGTPLSVIEAQFYAKPVVSTNAGGVKDTLIDGITGFILEKTDIASFSQKLQLLIEDKALRSYMGKAGHEFAKKKFSKQKEVAATKEFYFDLLLQKGYAF